MTRTHTQLHTHIQTHIQRGIHTETYCTVTVTVAAAPEHGRTRHVQHCRVHCAVRGQQHLEAGSNTEGGWEGVWAEVSTLRVRKNPEAIYPLNLILSSPSPCSLHLNAAIFPSPLPSPSLLSPQAPCNPSSTLLPALLLRYPRALFPASPRLPACPSPTCALGGYSCCAQRQKVSSCCGAARSDLWPTTTSATFTWSCGGYIQD